MNKKELFTEVASATGASKQVVTDVAEEIFAQIANRLAKGEDVLLRDFGNFKPVVRSARTGRNPQTGAPMEIPEKRIPQFKASKALAEKVK